MSKKPTEKKPIEDFFAAKKVRRSKLASLPIEEKVKILIELQQMASKAAEAGGRPSKKPWTID